ncbi:hypothetical protein EJ08DRAFT_715240 [Tothia fuscella]|uniref:Nitrogen permease regulator 3 n=1 Tax=Tothia fuscella TaxID=1048955 RepID=A0A9P4NS02_9PEZI|nr:hypothetical protein EJ08DRAFT_715240 [Tothia fuscella]
MRAQPATLPPNPCLVAILLVVKSRSGPRLVFHYPHTPSLSSASNTRNPNWFGTPGNQTDEAESGDSDWSSGSDDGGRTDDEDDDEGSRSSRAWSRGSKISGGRTGSRFESGRSFGSGRTKSSMAGGMREELDEEVVDGDRAHDGEGTGQDESKEDWKPKEQDEVEWERLLGFSADALSMLLTPGRVFNKRRFEVGIEQLVFLGAPMFVREDGEWKKRRRKIRDESESEDEGDGMSEHDHAQPPHENSGKSKAQSNGAKAEPFVITEHVSRRRGLSLQDLEDIPGFESAYGHGLVSGAASDISSEETKSNSTTYDGDMTMFNIVFVLNPPSLEHHSRVEEMYDYVVKRFAKTLKYQQAQSRYVSKESRLIIAMKDKAKESRAPIYSLWPSIVNQSALARAMALTYDHISNNKIAHINLSEGSDTSFQIPQAISTPYIPTPTEPQIPGLWLTTATLLDDDDADTMLSPHSALLLLDDDAALLKEVESDGKELSGPLSFFIRNLTPTKSLQKLSQVHSMSLKDVQFLARHLIYWRRARAIPPLRWRDIYIVSPNADMSTLETAIPAFAARFPTLPSLPKILHMLSGPPRSYSTLMPSKDHRTAYMEILAWLMRGGWVTQLRTFAWVRVKPEVKAAIAEKMNKELNASSASERLNGDHDNTKSDGVNGTGKNLTQSNLFQRSPEGREPGAGDNIFAQPSHLSPFLSPIARPASDAGSTSSSRTAVPNPSLIGSLSPLSRPDTSPFHRPSPLHLTQSASPSSASTHSSQVPTSPLTFPSDNDAPPPPPQLLSTNPADYDASLVDSPQKADALQSRWIEYIGAGFEDEELREKWPVLLKYFDGRHALEEISVREGLKKGKVAGLLGVLQRGGWVVSVRHW